MRRRWYLGAAIVGTSAVTAAYFLDHNHGHARRAFVVGRARRLLHHAHPAPAEGSTLLDRVESELYSDPTIPHGRISFDVVESTVTLRGQMDSVAEMARVEEAVRRIPGVAHVKSFLHMPGTPAPNKIPALVASAVATSKQRESL